MMMIFTTMNYAKTEVRRQYSFNYNTLIKDLVQLQPPDDIFRHLVRSCLTPHIRTQ